MRVMTLARFACLSVAAGFLLTLPALAQDTALVGTNDNYYVRLDANSGRASAASGLGSRGFMHTRSLAFDRDTNTLYGVASNIAQLITIERATGRGTAVGPVGFYTVDALAFDPNSGTLYGADANSNQLITINTATGRGTAVGALGFSNVFGLAYDPNSNTLFGSDVGSDELIIIDAATGQGTVVGALGFDDVEGLAFDPNTNTLYGTSTVSWQLITIDPETGAGTATVATGFENLRGLTFDPDTEMLYGTDGSGRLIKINMACSPSVDNGEPWCEGFESYALGTIQGNNWEGWYGDDLLRGIVTDEQNHTPGGTQALKIVDHDTVRVFTGYDSLVSQYWIISAHVYIPSAMTGDAFFLVNPDYDSIGHFATYAVYLRTDVAAGTIVAQEGYPAAGELPLVTDQWAEIECHVDFDSDLVIIYYNDTFLAGGAWTGSGGSLNIAAIDLFGDDTSGFYYDDLSASTIAEVPGQGAIVGSLGAGFLTGLTFHPTTNMLYATDVIGGQFVAIDPATGEWAVVGPLGFDSVYGLAFDANTNTLYGADTATDQLITVDPATGAGSAVGALGFEQVYGLAFDPDTSTLFGVDGNTNQLIVINPATGEGTARGSIPLVDGLAFDPTTDTLYGSGASHLLTIDPLTGGTTWVGVLASGSLLGLAFDANTNRLYGFNSLGRLFLVDTATVNVTSVGELGFIFVDALAFDSNTNTVYGSNQEWLITIDPASGEAATVGMVEFPVDSLAFDPNTDTLYATDVSADQLITIDSASGEGAAVGPLGFGGVYGLAFDPNTNTLYGTDNSTGQLITINTATGQGTAVGALYFYGVRGLHFDAATNTLYGIDRLTNQLITINTSTGRGSAVGPTVFMNIEGLAGFPDCNHNGVPDAQDIIDGTSQDIDTDGVPDECVDWTGNAGDTLWGTATNWDPQVVPNNAGDLKFTATIDGVASVVNLNITATINHLDLLNHATLNVNGGDLNIAADTSITSEGVITVSDSRTLSTQGRMVMNDICPPAGPSPAGCLPPRLAVSDSGVLVGTLLTLNGGASVDMQGTTDTHIYLTGQFELDRGGTYRADPERSADTAASLHAASVLITSDGASAGAMVLEDSMSVTIDGDCRLESDCPALAAESLGCLPPRLEVYENATLTIGGSVVLSGPAIVNMGGLVTAAPPRSMSAPGRSPAPHTMTLSFNFVNYMTSPMSFDWSEGSVLMNGVFQFFEVAGVDLGPNDSGFQNNFEIGSIEVHSDSTATFGDRIVNTGGAEVQYVDTLILQNGSVVIIDGTVLYFRSLVDQGATIMRINGGRLSGTTCTVAADCNDRDVCTFDQCVAEHCAYEPNLYGDIDHNTVANVFDIFCILDLLAGEPPDSPNCTLLTADIEPCEGNTVLNVFDMIAVLGVIAGTDPCCGGP